MSLLVSFALILGGIVLLLFGGDFLIRGATALARKWNIPSLLIGLTIVAFGTSAPELVV
ncbi:MAG TPA: sodium:proton exchanger, partial [Alphaproteobacteria bacterium]|nr:sodium:proton exchanger [Alphaproteobacteria bacterium]